MRVIIEEKSDDEEVENDKDPVFFGHIIVVGVHFTTH
jgi:hypothetical protein